MPNSIDWRKALQAEIADLPDIDSQRRSDTIGLEVDFIPGAYGTVREAAKIRRVSNIAFVRRAAYAMAAHDLGIPLMDIISRDPRMVRDTGQSMPDPELRRFGLWEIERLLGEGS